MKRRIEDLNGEFVEELRELESKWESKYNEMKDNLVSRLKKIE